MQSEVLFENMIHGHRPGHHPSGLLISGNFSVRSEDGDESSRIQGNVVLFELDGQESDSLSRGKSARSIDAQY
jgi:hypothetical protein